MIIKLTLLLLLACVADLLLRRATASLRHLVWVLALVSALLLPLGGLYAPRIAGGTFTIHTSSAIPTVLTAPLKFNWILATYIGGVVILLARLCLDILAANRLVRKARQSSLPGVLISDTASVPFAWGAIVVPPGFENRAAVLAHEAAHLERWDIWTSILSRVACAVYWFHPLVWWAAARMRLEADRACDDSVLRRGFINAGYAEDLVEVARTFVPTRLVPGAVTTSQLEVRIRHILAEGVDRGRLGMAGACVAVLISLAVFSPLAALSQQVGDDIYKVGHGVTAPRLLSKVNPQYTEKARGAKIAGSTLLSVTVGSDGVARDIHIKRSLDAGLDENAISAVQRWKFEPGTRNGKAVNVRATIEVNYRLK